MSEPVIEYGMKEIEPLLRGRYRLGPQIGKGGQGETFLGEDIELGIEVAIKELAIDVADSWKAIDLFQREARALKNLAHPAIPKYIDAFSEEDEDRGVRFFLVREYVPGKTFQELIDEDDLLASGDAYRFVEHLLDVLEYLHGLHPPVIHRDIKPSNLILRPDGSIALIDFGAVQVVTPHRTMGSTIVGTSGYVAPEQLAGRTRAASDLYSLGATVVHLMTHIHPADLPMERMRLRFEDHINAPMSMINFLQGVLDPVAEDRIGTAAQARAVLKGDAGAMAVRPRSSLEVMHRPAGSKIKVFEGQDGLSIKIPPSRRFRVWYGVTMGIALLAMLAMLPVVGSSISPWIVAAFVATALVGQIFISPTHLLIGPETYVLNRHTINGKHRGWSQDLIDIDYRRPGEEKLAYFLPVPSHLVLMEGIYTYPFGFGMTAAERRWVQSLLRRRIESQTAKISSDSQRRV